MRNKRESVFETNSSSVHSLVFTTPVDKKIDRRLVNKDGVITVRCSDFGDSGFVYGQHEKLQYLCTWITLKTMMENDYDSDECYDLNEYILKPIQEIDPSVKKIKVTDCYKAEFDHQTHPCNSECCVDIYNKRAVQSFILNDDVTIEMWRD